MMKSRFLIATLFLFACLLTDATPAKKADSDEFKSSITSISPNTQLLMRKYTWNPECPVPLNDLREIYLTYWGYDNKPHQGVLIVHKELAQEITQVFKTLYYHKFPIQRMELMEAFRGNDDASMAANNTSAFNCRAVTGRPGIFSQHSYGRAIDINPFYNPYVKDGNVLPATAKEFVDRSIPLPGKITEPSVVYTEFTKLGWDWGGHWFDLQDYQHFEKRADHEKRNPDGY